ncbi:MAG: hypothetical protein R2702_09505 [Acidimicrobiales bacterium]
MGDAPHDDRRRIDPGPTGIGARVACGRWENRRFEQERIAALASARQA